MVSLPEQATDPLAAGGCASPHVIWPAKRHRAPVPAGRGGRLQRARTAPDALLVDELLAQDVCVPAVLSEFPQHVEVHPAQRERAAPVAVDHVVQPQG
jgi:hypothetical protein